MDQNLFALLRTSRTAEGRDLYKPCVIAMTEMELEYLDESIKRSNERRWMVFFAWKTSRAKVAESVLVTFAPILIKEIKRLRQKERSE